MTSFADRRRAYQQAVDDQKTIDCREARDQVERTRKALTGSPEVAAAIAGHLATQGNLPGWMAVGHPWGQLAAVVLLPVAVGSAVAADRSGQVGQ